MATLPNELILEIIGHIDSFPPLERRQSLHVLASTSRYLYSLVIERLYRAPVLQTTHEARLYRRVFEGRLGPWAQNKRRKELEPITLNISQTDRRTPIVPHQTIPLYDHDDPDDDSTFLGKKRGCPVCLTSFDDPAAAGAGLDNSYPDKYLPPTLLSIIGTFSHVQSLTISRCALPDRAFVDLFDHTSTLRKTLVELHLTDICVFSGAVDWIFSARGWNLEIDDPDQVFRVENEIEDAEAEWSWNIWGRDWKDVVNEALAGAEHSYDTYRRAWWSRWRVPASGWALPRRDVGVAWASLVTLVMDVHRNDPYEFQTAFEPFYNGLFPSLKNYTLRSEDPVFYNNEDLLVICRSVTGQPAAVQNGTLLRPPNDNEFDFGPLSKGELEESGQLRCLATYQGPQLDFLDLSKMPVRFVEGDGL